jgi:hypothetical protein
MRMGKNAHGSKALSAGYSHAGPVAGAHVVGAQGPGGGKTGVKAASKKNPEIGVVGMTSGSAPKGMKVWTSNSKVIKG